MEGPADGDGGDGSEGCCEGVATSAYRCVFVTTMGPRSDAPFLWPPPPPKCVKVFKKNDISLYFCAVSAMRLEKPRSRWTGAFFCSDFYYSCRMERECNAYLFDYK